MIPNHILNNLNPDERVAILTQDGEIQILVHRSTDDPAAIRAHAARNGSTVLATHMQDHDAILALVESRERDIGGEA